MHTFSNTLQANIGEEACRPTRGVMQVVLGPRQAVRVGADPLAAAAALDGHQLGVLAVGPRGRPLLLGAGRGAGVLPVLTRALQAAVELKRRAVLVRLAVDVTVLRRAGCRAEIIY